MPQSGILIRAQISLLSGKIRAYLIQGSRLAAIPDSPAFRANLQGGDLIEEISTIGSLETGIRTLYGMARQPSREMPREILAGGTDISG
jgi:hypothetical protein